MDWEERDPNLKGKKKRQKHNKKLYGCNKNKNRINRNITSVLRDKGPDVTECELKKKEDKRQSVAKGKRKMKKKRDDILIIKKAKLMMEIPERPSNEEENILSVNINKEIKNGRREQVTRNEKKVKHQNEIDENDGDSKKDEENLEVRDERLNKNKGIIANDEVINVKYIKRKKTIREWLISTNTEEIRKRKRREEKEESTKKRSKINARKKRKRKDGEAKMNQDDGEKNEQGREDIDEGNVKIKEIKGKEEKRRKTEAEDIRRFFKKHDEH